VGRNARRGGSFKENLKGKGKGRVKLLGKTEQTKSGKKKGRKSYQLLRKKSKTTAHVIAQEEGEQYIKQKNRLNDHSQKACRKKRRIYRSKAALSEEKGTESRQ